MKYTGDVKHDYIKITQRTAAKIDNEILGNEIKKIIKQNLDYDILEILFLKFTPLTTIMLNNIHEIVDFLNEENKANKIDNETLSEMKKHIIEYFEEYTTSVKKIIDK